MAKTKGKNTAQIAQELAQPLLDAQGLELWDVQFMKEGASWYLRYFIDKPGGVNIQDCTDFSRAVEQRLDEADPIAQSYILEVCSPGIERRLITDAHYQRYIGEKVTVRLIRPVDGAREYTGVLLAKDGDEIRILLEDDKKLAFQKKEAAFVRVYAEF